MRCRLVWFLFNIS